jgi:hypothetical protein
MNCREVLIIFCNVDRYISMEHTKKSIGETSALGQQLASENNHYKSIKYRYSKSVAELHHFMRLGALGSYPCTVQ